MYFKMYMSCIYIYNNQLDLCLLFNVFHLNNYKDQKTGYKLQLYFELNDISNF